LKSWSRRHAEKSPDKTDFDAFRPVSCQLLGNQTKAQIADKMILLSQLQKSIIVIPAEAGIQSFQSVLDTGFRRCDGFGEF
jgi:hypothetical protein